MSDVNPVHGNEFFVAAQVDRGDGVLGAVSTSSACRRQNTEWTGQQMACAAHLTEGDQFADLRARDRFSAQSQFRIDGYFKTHVTAKFRKQIHIPGCFVAETEVVAFVYLARVQSFFQDVVGEGFWSHERQVAREREEKNGIKAGSPEQSKPFGSRSKQLKSRIRSQDPHGMRLEGDRHGPASLLLCARDDVNENPGMRAMHSVKVTDAQERR